MTAVWIVTGIAAWIALSIATALILGATARAHRRRVADERSAQLLQQAYDAAVKHDNDQARTDDDNGGHDEPKSGQRP